MALLMALTVIVCAWLAVQGSKEHSHGLSIAAIAVLVTCPFWMQSLDGYLHRNKDSIRQKRAEAAESIKRLTAMGCLFVLLYVFLILILREFANK